MSLKTFKWYCSPPCASLLREEFPCQGVRNLKKTLPKALRTQTLTAFTSNSSFVWFGRYGLAALVWLVWCHHDFLNIELNDPWSKMICKDCLIRCYIHPQIILLYQYRFVVVVIVEDYGPMGFTPLYKSNCLTVQTPSP